MVYALTCLHDARSRLLWGLSPMTLPLHSHSLKPVSAANALTAIRRVLSIEAAAIERLSARLGLEVSEAVQTIQGLSVRGGRLVVMGMGLPPPSLQPVPPLFSFIPPRPNTATSE
jgi:hypothetical protein